MAAKLTREACRAARALLGLTTHELASKIGVSPTTLNGVEGGQPIRESTEVKIVDGLEKLGVEITNGRGTGARLVFVEIRPQQSNNGEWGVSARWKAEDQPNWLEVRAAARAADDAGMHGDSIVERALRSAIEQAIRFGGGQGRGLESKTLPQLRQSWILREDAPGIFSASEGPPGGNSRTIGGTREQLEGRLLDEGCWRSRYNPDEWIKP